VQPIQRALMLLGDSLERLCGNVSQWSLDDPQQLRLLVLITSFNHGQLPDIAPPCSDEFLFTKGVDSIELETYQYLHGDDVIVLRESGTNRTFITSLIDGLYDTQYGLYALNALPLLLAFALGVKLAMHMDWKHKYTLNRRSSAPDSAQEYELHDRVDINGDRGVGGGESDSVSRVSLSHREETFDEVDI
jgi:hypothetical protein